jgi:hypothetical protein
MESLGLSPKHALKKYDHSRASHTMRVQNVHRRGRVTLLLKTLRDCLTITDSSHGSHSIDLWSDLFIPTLAWFLYAMDEYFSLASNPKPPVPKALFKRQLEWSSDRWPELATAVERLARQQPTVTTLMWPDYPQPSTLSITLCMLALSIVLLDANVDTPKSRWSSSYPCGTMGRPSDNFQGDASRRYSLSQVPRLSYI